MSGPLTASFLAPDNSRMAAEIRRLYILYTCSRKTPQDQLAAQRALASIERRYSASSLPREDSPVILSPLPLTDNEAIALDFLLAPLGVDSSAAVDDYESAPAMTHEELDMELDMALAAMASRPQEEFDWCSPEYMNELAYGGEECRISPVQYDLFDHLK